MTAQLKDVTVEKLGLVTTGANKEEFFLLKHDSEANSEANNEATAQIAESIWQRLLKALRRPSGEPTALTAEALTVASDPEAALPVSATGVLSDALSDSLSDAPILGQPVAPDNVVEKIKETVVEEAMEKDMVAKSDYDALVKTVEGLQARVAQAEAETDAARHTQERLTEIAKAGELLALPVNPTELGDALYKLGQSDPALKQYFAALLKTADNMLAGLGIFEERGTAQAAPYEDPVAKAAAAEDPRAALLNLSPQAAVAYIKARQAAVSGRRM